MCTLPLTTGLLGGRILDGIIKTYADHIVVQAKPVDPDVTLWDTTRDCPIGNKDALLDLKDPQDTTVAITCGAVSDGNQQKFPQHWSEYIAMSPTALRKTIDKDDTFSDNRIQKAQAPSLLSRIKRKASNARVKQVDLLDTIEVTLIHEVGIFSLRPLLFLSRDEELCVYSW
ncbi:hypothetical protein PG984_006508 [Apiospora sp. TS-2023a]